MERKAALRKSRNGTVSVKGRMNLREASSEIVGRNAKAEARRDLGKKMRGEKITFSG